MQTASLLFIGFSLGAVFLLAIGNLLQRPEPRLSAGQWARFLLVAGLASIQSLHFLSIWKFAVFSVVKLLLPVNHWSKTMIIYLKSLPPNQPPLAGRRCRTTRYRRRL